MGIEWDNPGTHLPALKKEAPPVVGVDALLAVADVRLWAADVPRGILRNFYEGVVGLKFVKAAAGEDHVQFIHLRRRVLLERGSGALGRVAFLVKDFADVLLRLHGRSIAYELLHIDSGMTRMAVLRDPAGNWVHLVETRLF